VPPDTALGRAAKIALCNEALTLVMEEDVHADSRIRELASDDIIKRSPSDPSEVLKLLTDAAVKYAVPAAAPAPVMPATICEYPIEYMRVGSHEELLEFAKGYSGGPRETPRDHPQDVLAQTASLLTAMAEKKEVFTSKAGQEVFNYVAVGFVGGVVDFEYVGSAICLQGRHTSRENSVNDSDPNDGYATWLARQKTAGTKDIKLLVGFFGMIVPEADDTLVIHGHGHAPMLCGESRLIYELWNEKNVINMNPIALTLQGRFSRLSALAAAFSGNFQKAEQRGQLLRLMELFPDRFTTDASVAAAAAAAGLPKVFCGPAVVRG